MQKWVRTACSGVTGGTVEPGCRQHGQAGCLHSSQGWLTRLVQCRAGDGAFVDPHLTPFACGVCLWWTTGRHGWGGQEAREQSRVRHVEKLAPLQECEATGRCKRSVCAPRPCINECINEMWLTCARRAGVSKRCCRLQSARSIHSLLRYVQGAHLSCRHAQLQLNVVGITMPTG